MAATEPRASSLRVSCCDEILLLQLHDPAGTERPRLTRALLDELRAALHWFARHAAWRGAVLTGSPTCFAAGADLTEVTVLRGASALRFAALGQEVLRRIECSVKPVVAAVCGFCMGGGVDLALSCQARIASPDAVFAHPGATLGLMTGWGGTQRLPRALGPQGRSVALELMITGRGMLAPEALARGWVHRVVTTERAIDEAIALARRNAQTYTAGLPGSTFGFRRGYF
jgi:enoyl-CoA hydratase